MIIVNDLKPGTTFIYEGNLYLTLSTSLNKTAMRQMVVKAHAKDMRTGTIKDVVFTGGDKVEQANIEKSEMQYLYDAGEELVFMDTTTYDQIEIPKSRLEWEMNFLKPNDNVMITSYEGEILGIQLPDKVVLQVVEAEQAVKGDTATAATKNAVLETGWQIKVPLFIEQDEMVIISTIDGKYCGRA
ncbi:MAG: elongation factor P [Erysipelotrichaceae bacterium]|nr:elongation factor P [Erysipelotrichaceae bacterium]